MDAWRFVETLCAAPGLRALAETVSRAEVLEAFLQEHPNATGNLLLDVRTAVLMKEHGIGVIYTRDTDLHRFPSLEVIDPLVQGS